MDSQPGRLILRIRTATGEEIDILDTQNGHLVGQVKATRRKMKLVLPRELRTRIAEHARAALPGECCGLIEGVREGDMARVLALHPRAQHRRRAATVSRSIPRIISPR